MPSRQPPLTPEQRTLRARIAAHTKHAKHDPRESTTAARQKFMDRFEREADPDGVLKPEERARRAAQLRKAYFTRLALASSRARSKGGPDAAA